MSKRLLSSYKWESEGEFSMFQNKITTIKQAKTLTLIIIMIRQMPTAFLLELFDFVSKRFNGGPGYVINVENITPINMTEVIQGMINKGEK